MPKAKKLPSGSWRCRAYSHSELVFDENKNPVMDLRTGSQKKKDIFESFTSDDPSPAGKREAEFMAAEFAMNKKQKSQERHLTFGEALDRYISTRKRSKSVSPRTVKNYKDMKDGFLKSLADLNIYDMTQESIQEFVNKDSQAHAPKTVRDNHGLVSAVLSEFRPEFVLKTSLPKVVPPKLYIPTDSDVQKIIASSQGGVLELPILLAAFGPMRRGEICAFIPSRDANGPTVHVIENVVQDENKQWVVSSTKNYAGDRFITFPDFVAEKWRGISGAVTDLNPNALTSRWGRFLKKIDVPHFRFHDLRHYSASIQHALGVPDAYIMARGGWKNDKVLKEIYRHTMADKISEMDALANDHFSSLISTNKPENS